MMLEEIVRRQRERYRLGEDSMGAENETAQPETGAASDVKTVGAKVPASMRDRLTKLKRSRGMKSIAEALVYAAAKGLDGLGI